MFQPEVQIFGHGSPLMSKRRGCFALACFALVAWVSPALADWRVSKESIKIDNWTFVPILDGAKSSPTVGSFLALKEKATVTGSNLTAVWYKRPASGTGVWETWTWPDAPPETAVKSLQSLLSIGSIDDGNWPSEFLPDAGTSSESPVPYDKGAIADDAINAALVNHPDRGFLIELLSDMGLKVASIKFDNMESAGCGQADWLGTLTNSVEAVSAAPFTTTPHPAQSALLSFIAGCLPPAPPCATVQWIRKIAPIATSCASPSAWTSSISPTTGMCVYTRTQDCSDFVTGLISGPPTCQWVGYRFRRDSTFTQTISCPAPCLPGAPSCVLGFIPFTPDGPVTPGPWY